MFNYPQRHGLGPDESLHGNEKVREGGRPGGGVCLTRIETKRFSVRSRQRKQIAIM